MKLLTIKAWRRPLYFHRVLEALRSCRRINQYHILFLLDWHDQNTRTGMMYYAKRAFREKRTTGELILPPTNMGCAGATIELFRLAFEEHKADYMIHLEDDTVPGADFLEYMEWAGRELERDSNLFAVCPFNRKVMHHARPQTGDPAGSYLRAWFEAGGGCGFSKRTWDTMQDMGGMFGADGQCNSPLVGEEWKASLSNTPYGSWVWPINQYFRERSTDRHLCIYPIVSRTQNIGAKEGRFNPDPTFHAQRIYDDTWIGATASPSKTFDYYLQEEPVCLEQQ